MSKGIVERYASFVASNSRFVILAFLVITALVGAGAIVGESEDGEIGQFETDSPERDALQEIESTYDTDDAIVTQIVVREEDGDVLTRESLLNSLRLQQEIRENESINSTLQETGGMVGIENVVATAASVEDRRNQRGNGSAAEAGESGQFPPIDVQIEALESRSDEEVESLLQRVLDPDATVPGGDPYEFLPSDYEPGTTSADARITFVFQADESGSGEDPADAYNAQLAIESLVDQRFDGAFVFGQGITDDASSRAVGDSFTIITPVALILVLGVLGIAYRDVADVLVSVVGIAIVMAWLAGVQGWLEVPSSQLLIAVPFLLIGLSIDYSLHVVMRYREARNGSLDTDGKSTGVRDQTTAMRLAVVGVALALAAATFSTGIGFLSNYVSPLRAIRDFAVLSAAGIVATFLVFIALVPAMKLEVERLFQRFGRDRRKPAVGGGSGPINYLLSGTVTLAQRAPVAIIAVALVAAVAGGYGATTIDTEFNQADFLPEDAPEWAKSLPGPFAPDSYDVRNNLAYLSDNFRQQGEGSEAQILLRENVTSPATLDAIEQTTNSPDEESTIVRRSDGTAAVESPVSLIRTVARQNETVANAVAERDTDDDGLPDRDVVAVYDLLFDADSERASSVLARGEDEQYQSARLLVGVQADASSQSINEDVQAFASTIEGNAPVTAIATGGPVISAGLQDALLETLIQGFAVTLVVILVFLVALYWWRHRAPGLGVVTLAPVVVALAWLLGTMAVFDIAFNSETAVITSLAIGLGVDYSIHLSERFVDERSRRESLESALSAAVTGTGGALLGSAATTACGFGVLALALSPPLQRFGIVTGLSIVYAFVACVILLPCLFAVRERVLDWRTTA
ncbi:efflux RND transporter permease subunit [Haladaptatus cibarius]|uniref:efflux RND transporter permease subunit n=1 Tax=Haladaptatus cibarius TaxID=453847 RepID=UPI0006785FD7|nr:MMPL family transporter [Haladaptatus cibarius]